MARKTKKTVWHKKTGKFIPSAALKPHAGSGASPDSPPDAASPKIPSSPRRQRLQDFSKKLSAQIKRAVRESGDDRR